MKAEGGKHFLIVGGTRGLGLQLAKTARLRGDRVTLTGRDRAVAEAVAKEIDAEGVSGRGCDLTEWSSISELFSDTGSIDHLVVTAIDRDHNPIADFRPAESARTLLMKTVGYADLVHHALPHFTAQSSVVLFSGLSMWRPIPGSTTISMANAAIIALTRSLALEIAPTRVNAITPGIVVGARADDDTDPARSAFLNAMRERTPTKRLPTTHDIVAATFALTDNPAINAENLTVDAGLRLS